jgi:hypothetical protein
MCRNALGFGGTGILTDEATLGIDMAIAPGDLRKIANIIHRVGGFVAALNIVAGGLCLAAPGK